MDYTKIDNVKVKGINITDYPDFCDAFIVSADYNGKKMTEEQLEELSFDTDFLYDKILEQLI
jgi:hypothetical protein